VEQVLEAIKAAAPAAQQAAGTASSMMGH